ncbi:hypothetical protein GQ651_13520 [Alphaproteobacteria bacterium GH1-50]|uniref:Uncharacterized protein n=1 Tax=Kangsaoukella pontilimi TaxID=2691042 RepID=A0A7C9MFG1_9RHOB|nr:hypothetical protein [Kangsaoukella pontilimi]MXQ08872.1 hypothetical protein [Kangsaoukella pontilimi]
MCITPQALIAFLSLLSPEIVESAPARVVVHADVGPTVWVAEDDLWCTDAPDRASAAAAE